MNIKLKRIDEAYRFEAISPRDDVLHTDGSQKIGGSEQGWRPMELLLVSLASCSAIDIISILKKQRQDIKDFSIDISGVRKEGIPAPFKSINIHFLIRGEVKKKKLEKAIELTKGKYCSVYFSLHPEIKITYTYQIDH